MENYYVDATKYSLKIDMNVKTGIIEMVGSSYPENVNGYFQPVITWLKQFITEINKEITLNFHLEYFNTSSSKCLLDIISILEDYHNNDNKVIINWHYRESDEDMLEAGEEFNEDIDIEMNFITI